MDPTQIILAQRRPTNQLRYDHAAFEARILRAEKRREAVNVVIAMLIGMMGRGVAALGLAVGALTRRRVR